LGDDWLSAKEDHYRLLQRRGFPMAAENFPPVGQAACWHEDLLRNGAPKSAMAVARQLARLCGNDSEVTITYRSLSDAVGLRDAAGRTRAYTERGLQWLRENGWLGVETTGKGYTARTRFSLTIGQRWPDIEDTALSNVGQMWEATLARDNEHRT
jgi:hypothetical protein